jgi:hypothetical protein
VWLKYVDAGWQPALRFNSVLLHHAVEFAAFDAENAGGGGLVTVLPFKHFRDVLPLKCQQRTLRGVGFGVPGRRLRLKFVGQVFNRYHIVCENFRSLDGVDELPYVAGPVKRFERIARVIFQLIVFAEKVIDQQADIARSIS